MPTETQSKTMRAVLYGGPGQILELTRDSPIPNPDFEKDEHLLKVHAVAITRGELQWPFPPGTFQNYSPGVEMAGEIIANPPGSKYTVGSKVYMRTTSPRSGSARENTIALGKELAFRPQNLTAEQAASVPVSALTAWQALFVEAGYEPVFEGQQKSTSPEQRKRILVIGASGSVGLWTTQLASAAGHWVVGTCHTRNMTRVQELGAHEVIDYTKMSVREWLQKNKTLGTFDLVLDCVGGPGSADGWHAAHPDHGLVLNIIAPNDWVTWRLDRPDGVSPNIKGRFFIMEPNGHQLQKITDLIEAGKVGPVVDQTYSLEDYKQAFEHAENGKGMGKVVMRVQEG